MVVIRKCRTDSHAEESSEEDEPYIAPKRKGGRVVSGSGINFGLLEDGHSDSDILVDVSDLDDGPIAPVLKNGLLVNPTEAASEEEDRVESVAEQNVYARSRIPGWKHPLKVTHEKKVLSMLKVSKFSSPLDKTNLDRTNGKQKAACSRPTTTTGTT
jgi:hypothetical protein